MEKEDVLQIIASTPKGEERKRLLDDDRLRNLVLNTGANVTIFSGEIKDGKTFKEMFENVFIGLIQRKNKKGQPNGLGALGGLAERTSSKEFDLMSEEEKKGLVGKKDDVIIKKGKTILIDNIDIIRKNNVLRETHEELDDLGITNISIDPEKLLLIPMPKVKDDNYMINIWNGDRPCFAVNPYCYLYKDESNLLDVISASAREKDGGEASVYRKVPLFKALSAYGNRADKKEEALEDGRSAVKDYRYPHEHLSAWFLASQLLENNPDKFIALTQEVQKSAHHPISFANLAQATGQTLEDLGNVLNLSGETLKKADKECAEILSLNVRLVANTYNR